MREATAKGGKVAPIITPASAMTETDVMIVIDALLREANLDLSEVQMWRSLGSAY